MPTTSEQTHFNAAASPDEAILALPLTKILATVGPATASAQGIARLVEAGASLFRLNFSHGTLEAHAASARFIRDAEKACRRPLAILGDLQGPKIRVGAVEGDGIEVQPGDVIVFERGSFAGSKAGPNEPLRLSCTYPKLIDEVEPGQRVLINDGAVRTIVVVRQADRIECAVSSRGGGRVSSGKGINLPDTHLSLPALGERDKQNAHWAIENELDFLALSFVRSASDVQALRRLVEGMQASKERRLRIISKIELPAAVRAIDEILEVCDGLMIARGDLGVEMELAQVPIIQKQLLAAADQWGKPCIVATQMLESMIKSPTPTRAEVTDVANAIMDGTDALMLSGETAVGQYPALAVQNMQRIAQVTEAHLASLPAKSSPPARLVASRYRTAALAHGVWTVAQDIAAKFIVVWSQSGGGARYLSQNSFTIPIFAITSDERAARSMQLLRGVVPLVMPVPEDPAHFTRMVDGYLQETGWAVAGDTCILVAGGPIGKAGVTNTMAIHRVGDEATGYLSL